MRSRTIALLCVCLILFIFQAAAEAQAAPPARLDTFVTGAGDGYFSLSLTPTTAQPQRRPCDIVVVFDTSASQIGPYRDKALAAVEALLTSLGPQDRVQLIAADVNTALLTQTFVAPSGDEIGRALEALRRRVPLGSSDMPLALQTVLTAFGDKTAAGRKRTALYLGDGMSGANFINSDKLRKLTDAFVKKHISVSSYAIGPVVNLPWFGALAKGTGGIVVIDDEHVAGGAIGEQLGNSAVVPIVWPQSVQLPAGFQSAYYRGVPPLRFDRDTVVVGTYHPQTGGDGSVALGVKGTLAEMPVSLAWNVKAGKPNDDNASLAQIVAVAQQDGGVSMPTVDSRALADVRQLVKFQTFALGRLGQQAVATGNLTAAAKLADEVARREPNDPGALTIRRAVAHGQKSTPAHPASAVVRQDRGGEDDAFVPEASDGDLLNEVERQQRVLIGFLRSEVNNALKEANASMAVDPEGTRSRLKLLLDKIQHTAELEPEVRGQLVDKIEAALRATDRQVIVKTQQDLMRQQIAAEGEARERINRELFLQEQKVDQLMARFDALMDEERYRDAEALADIAEEIEPGRPGLRGAELTARMVGYTADIMAVLDLRRKGFVDATYQIELSHVPTPDEPPILYPDPEVWQLLTERRKKYKAVDLTQHGPTETAILSALDEKTDLDFTDQALADVVEYLKQRHGIEIQLDSKALSDAGVATDTPVTRNIRGISLRSALKLLLSEYDLTYVIANEVLMITSKTEAENKLSTRVYPVGDLVVPIQTPMMGRGRF